MARKPTIAGRPMPAWSAAAVKLAGLALLVLIGWQATRLEALATRPAPAEAPLGYARVPPPEARVAAAAAAPAGGDAATPAVPAARMLRLDRPLLHGDYAWNDRGVPPGRIEILVDLSRQTLFVFRAGHEIGRAVILYGTDEDPTPTGTFTITEKDRDHVSNRYEAIMPFMLRLTNDGIAIHGSQVRYGWASRGCIGVPDEFAAMLFEQARIGDRVTIVAGDAAPSRAPAPVPAV